MEGRGTGSERRKRDETAKVHGGRGWKWPFAVKTAVQWKYRVVALEPCPGWNLIKVQYSGRLCLAKRIR